MRQLPTPYLPAVGAQTASGQWLQACQIVALPTRDYWVNAKLMWIILYKAGFPSNLGGRLSSVIDVTTSESSNSNYKINGGIGLISSRFTLDLPIKNKGGFLISGRRSYIDRIFKLVNSDEESSLPFFYDFNLNFNYKLKPK